jgi:hypothetical protein
MHLMKEMQILTHAPSCNSALRDPTSTPVSAGRSVLRGARSAAQYRSRDDRKRGGPPLQFLTEAVPLPVATLVVAEKCQAVLGSLVW